MPANTTPPNSCGHSHHTKNKNKNESTAAHKGRRPFTAQLLPAVLLPLAALCSASRMVLTVCFTSLLSSAVTACSWLSSLARVDTLDTNWFNFSGSCSPYTGRGRGRAGQDSQRALCDRQAGRQADGNGLSATAESLQTCKA